MQIRSRVFLIRLETLVVVINYRVKNTLEFLIRLLISSNQTFF
jgi:hypothetical protein